MRRVVIDNTRIDFEFEDGYIVFYDVYDLLLKKKLTPSDKWKDAMQFECYYQSVKNKVEETLEEDTEKTRQKWIYRKKLRDELL